ncbi:MAG: PEP-CTERM sorting domain-containing protein [Verrucomicrobiota bacterium]|jgi:hypothetical protein
MKRIGVFFGLGFAIVGLSLMRLQAQQLPFNIGYYFTSVTTNSGTVDPTPVPTAQGVTFGSFSAVGYVGSPAVIRKFCWTGNDLGGIPYSTNFDDFTGSLNEAKYYDVTFTPQAGYALDLVTISFSLNRIYNGIRNYAVRSSVDDFAANLPACINPYTPDLGVGPDNSFRWVRDEAFPSDHAQNEVDLGADFSGLTSPVTFRFYGWNAESSTGYFSIDNVMVTGSTEPVPEPGALAMLALGTMLFGLGCHRRFGCGTVGNHREITSVRGFQSRGLPGLASEPLPSARKEPDGCHGWSPRS